MQPADRPLGLVRKLRFRFGFLVQRRGETTPALVARLAADAWNRLEVGGYNLWTHPEARLAIRDRGGLTFAIVGEAFVESGQPLAEALDAVDPDDEGSLFELLDRLSGRFAVLAVAGDRLRVFHDPIGSRAVYYHDRAPLAVASHAALLAEAVGAPGDLGIAAYMADPDYLARKVRYLPGDLTVHAGVLALPPDMLFDSASMATRRHWPRQPNAARSLDEFRAAAVESLTALARHVGDAGGTLVLGLTGGVDSRAALAVFRAAGTRLETVTWNRQRLVPGEAAIIDRLVAAAGVAHEYLALPRRAGQMGRLARLNQGEFFLRSSRLACGLRRRYGRRRDAVLVRGWGGEVARVYYNHRLRPMDSLRPEEMARAYLAAPRVAHADPASPAQRKRTEDYFAAFAARCGHAELAGLGYDPNDIFYLEHRMGMWSAAANNEVDAAMSCLVAYNGRRLFATAFGLPLSLRDDKRLLLDIASAIDPAYARVPLTGASNGLNGRLHRLASLVARTSRRFGRRRPAPAEPPREPPAKAS